MSNINFISRSMEKYKYNLNVLWNYQLWICKIYSAKYQRHSRCIENYDLNVNSCAKNIETQSRKCKAIISLTMQ